ncbi:MAG: hypothetical protein RIQ79_8 [Verrucomicrobiota bacterium]|jgi:general secretion pathway protein G
MHTYPTRSRLTTRHAFTLIELLTVIAIIGILAAIIIPTVSKVRKTAKKAQCVARMRQWGNAISLQTNDAKGKVILDFKKDPIDTNKYLLDSYFNSGGNTVVEESSGKTTDNKTATKAFWGCPTGINGGATLTASQYAFVIPIGASRPAVAVTILGASVSNFYSITDSSSPAKLLLMIEVKNGSSPLDTKTTADIQGQLTGANAVTSMQTSDGFVRHGGTANALFLDGHVSGLTVSDTDYTNTDSKVSLERYFSLK